MASLASYTGLRIPNFLVEVKVIHKKLLTQVYTLRHICIQIKDQKIRKKTTNLNGFQPNVGLTLN